MNPLTLPLLPLAWMYDGVTRLRNFLFDKGFRRQRSFTLPAIAIGNLAVGGTGKTPHADYTVNLLKHSLRVALLSRGYGRRTKGFREATASSTAEEIGDEPLQLHLKHPDIRVAVCEDRCKGIDQLLSAGEAPQVIVLDDAYQHRYVKAGLYVLLTDFHRLYSSDYLLPYGRLREARCGARRADIVIVTKCPPALTEEETAQVRAQLNPLPTQTVLFSTMTYGPLRPLFPDEAAAEVDEQSALVVAGIAHPEPLVQHFAEKDASVRLLRFADHHAFTASDVDRIEAAFSSLPAGTLVVTTEKDAVRLRPWASRMSSKLRRALRVQPIEVAFLSNGMEIYNHIIINYARNNQTNS